MIEDYTTRLGSLVIGLVLLISLALGLSPKTQVWAEAYHIIHIKTPPTTHHHHHHTNFSKAFRLFRRSGLGISILQE